MSITLALAESFHVYYRQLARKENWKVEYDLPFDKLSDEIRDDNVAAAMRIPEVLSMAGLQVAIGEDGPWQDKGEEAKIKAHIEHHLELLAEAKHNGWLDFKIKNGWKYGETRDSRKKIHDCLKRYAVLDENEKKKDRDAVKNYPEIVNSAGCWIIFEKKGC